jgi:uncharacterized membrane protein YdbT with pleckstrin-like domain
VPFVRAARPADEAQRKRDSMSETLWRDRKRTIFGLPLSFTTYRLTEDRLFIETGFLNKHEDEIRLYRVLDVSLNRPLGQRLFGVGTVRCATSDQSMGTFDLGPVKRPKDVKELLSQTVEAARSAKGVATREFMDDDRAEAPGDEA